MIALRVCMHFILFLCMRNTIKKSFLKKKITACNAVAAYYVCNNNAMSLSVTGVLVGINQKTVLAIRN